MNLRKLCSLGALLAGIAGTTQANMLVAEMHGLPEQLHVSLGGQHEAIAAWVVQVGSQSWVGIQRLDSRGGALWGKEGIRLNASAFAKKDFQMAVNSDVVALLWREDLGKESQLWFQEINEEGHLKWSEPGLLIASGSVSGATALDIDPKGKVILAWETVDQGHPGIYYQQIDAKGALKWTNPRPLFVDTAVQKAPVIAHDSQGGYFVVSRSSNPPSSSLLAHHFNAGGRPMWDLRGMLITTKGSHPAVQAVVVTPRHDLVVVWKDQNQAGDDWMAQRLDASGQRLWTDDGIRLMEESSYQDNASVALNSGGQLTLAWEDSRTEPRKIYVQQWDERGLPCWGPSGMAVVNRMEMEERDPMVTMRGSDAWVLWRDSYDVAWQLYSQRIKASGKLQSDSGNRVMTLRPLTSRPVSIGDARGGFVVFWSEQVGPQTWQLQALRK